MGKDSAAELPPQGVSGQTLDHWSWIARARAAARRSVESGAPPAGAPDDRLAEPPGPATD